MRKPHQVKINPFEQVAWHCRRDALLTEVLQQFADFHYRNDPLKRWRYLRKDGPFELYTDAQESPNRSDKACQSVLSTGLAPGNAEDMLSSLLISTTSELHTQLALTEPSATDGVLIDVFTCDYHSKDLIFAGVKWTAHKSNLIFNQSHDALVYEALGWVQDEHNETFAWHVLFSIDMPEFPRGFVDSNWQRAVVTRASLFHQVQGHYLECFTRIELDAKGTKLGLAKELPSNAFANTYQYALLSGGAKRYSLLVEESKGKFVPASKKCEVCTRKPLLGKLQQCSGCVQYACRRCRKTRPIFKLAPGKDKVIKRTFCQLCVGKVEDEQYTNWSLKSQAASGCSLSPPSRQYSDDYVNKTTPTYCERNDDVRSVASSLSMATAKPEASPKGNLTSPTANSDGTSTLKFEADLNDLKNNLDEWNMQENNLLQQMKVNMIAKDESLEINEHRISASELD